MSDAKDPRYLRQLQSNRFLAKKHKRKIRIESIGDFSASPHEISTTPNLSPPVRLSESTQLDAQHEAVVQANEEIEALSEIDQAAQVEADLAMHLREAENDAAYEAILLQEVQRVERRAMFNFRLPVELAQMVFDYAINSERESARDDQRMLLAIQQTCGRWREIEPLDCYSYVFKSEDGRHAFDEELELDKHTYSSMRKLELIYRIRYAGDIKVVLAGASNVEILRIVFTNNLGMVGCLQDVFRLSTLRRLKLVLDNSTGGLIIPMELAFEALPGLEELELSGIRLASRRFGAEIQSTRLIRFKVTLEDDRDILPFLYILVASSHLLRLDISQPPKILLFDPVRGASFRYVLEGVARQLLSYNCPSRDFDLLMPNLIAPDVQFRPRSDSKSNRLPFDYSIDISPYFPAPRHLIIRAEVDDTWNLTTRLATDHMRKRYLEEGRLTEMPSGFLEDFYTSFRRWTSDHQSRPESITLKFDISPPLRLRRRYIEGRRKYVRDVRFLTHHLIWSFTKSIGVKLVYCNEKRVYEGGDEFGYDDDYVFDMLTVDTTMEWEDLEKVKHNGYESDEDWEDDEEDEVATDDYRGRPGSSRHRPISAGNAASINDDTEGSESGSDWNDIDDMIEPFDGIRGNDHDVNFDYHKAAVAGAGFKTSEFEQMKGFEF